MSKYICSVCGFVYDESLGIEEAGIAAGTKFDDLPDDWICPLCGAAKSEFVKQGESQTPKTPESPPQYSAEDIKELSSVETSILCSNLARGCEKQYMNKEAALFYELSDYYKDIAARPAAASFSKLTEYVESDLDSGFANATAAARYDADRGALRALVWSEKVTKILKSLLKHFEKEGEAMFENTGVYVCTVCGFIYVGDNPPELCPVCKVPNWKFEKIDGRAQ